MAKDLYIRTPETNQRVQDNDLKVVGSLAIPTIDGDNEDEQIENGIGIVEGVPSWFDGTVWNPLGAGYVYLTQTSPYYSSASGGSITIPDFDTDYPILSANGIVRMQGWITVDGTEVEVDIIPVVTRVSGNITAATFNFGIDPASTITTFKLRMY